MDTATQRRRGGETERETILNKVLLGHFLQLLGSSCAALIYIYIYIYKLYICIYTLMYIYI